MQKASGILSYFTRHHTIANLLMVLMVAAGIFAFPNMRAQFFPDVIIDDVTVSTSWRGAGAEDVDRAIVQIMEPTLLAVEGVTSTAARSSEGSARITLEFEPGWDMSRAADDVQVAVDSVVGQLPDDAEDPRVRRGAWRDRVTDVVITGPVGVDQLGRFADEFVVRLFAEGVTRTTIRGVAAPSTIVEVPSLSLIQYDVSMSEIADAIEEEAVADPAGDVSNAARVRTGVAKRGADEIGDIVLRSNPDGSKLRISDVATVRVEGIDRNRAYFVGENPAISVRVDRSEQGDAIDIQRTVEEVAAELTTTLPAGVSIDLIRTRAEAITGRLNILMDNGLMGLALVVGLLFLFLNARTAFWVAAGIPVAMSAAIALMFAAGLTINMISLFALIITLGIVVDDAIVVGEHADYRFRTLGEPPEVAAENAARRMFTPVFCATITTIIAFFGLVVIGGRFGDLIQDIPFTVIVVLIASLVECFLILPHHMSRALAASQNERWYDWPSRTVNRGFNWVRDTLFRRFMRLVIALRYPVFAGAIVLLASQAVLFINGDVNWRFFNAPERGSVTGNFAMAPGATREDTLEMMLIMQKAAEDLGREYEERHGTNPISYAIAEIGGNSGRGLAGSETKEPDQLGSLAIELIDADSRPYSSFAFVADLQDRVPRHPLVETISFRGWRSGPGGDSLSVELYGANAETLKDASENLQATLSQFPEVSALQDNLAFDKEELILELTPQGQTLGFSIDDLGRVLRNRLNGIDAVEFPDGTRSATIRVELPTGELTADFMDRMQLRTDEGAYVPLADIVTVDRRTGFSTVRRENGIQLISVTGDLSEDDPARATAIQEQMEAEILPQLAEDFSIQYQFSGLNEQENSFLTDARNGLMLVLLGIFLALSWIFGSWTRPLVVMAIIPFGAVGMIWGHYIWDVPLSMFSIVGFLGMTGIIINDSIVLVTTIDEYAEDRGLIPAIIDGASDRLRPVLLTTLTTVLGLAPLLYEGSNQAEFLKPTVITLVYGLGFGMFLVLLIVPALIAVQMDVGSQIRTFRRSLAMGRRAPVAVWASRLGVLAVAAAFVATLGWTLAFDTMAGPLADLGTEGLGAAFVGFAALSAASLVVIYVMTALGLAVSRRKSAA
ncbi:efflux RND transporter permease subunit [Shimia ponticola]|uniref:efflux RND transporter permease subunit n=1 Tax=Shimia ponticola TaxID=2582893 RepID=UPI0011BDB446|nr:efflux RND transporter permease subunit [Shimia ponticola]